MLDVGRGGAGKRGGGGEDKEECACAVREFPAESRCREMLRSVHYRRAVWRWAERGISLSPLYLPSIADVLALPGFVMCKNVVQR